MCQNFSARGRPAGGGGARLFSVNLGPPDISETRYGKVPVLGTVQKLLQYTIKHEDGHHIDFRQMSVYPGEITAYNCKTAFTLHVVESASDDYNLYTCVW